MIVSKVESLSKNRYKVFLDEQFAFVLYKGELSRFHLREGKEISTEIYREICDEILLKRAKRKSLHLLTDMDRTEGELRSKLAVAGYPEDVVEKAIAYVTGFGYINDQEYCNRYVASHKYKKSRRQMQAELIRKGLSREEIDRAMESEYEREDAVQSIDRILKRRHYDPIEATDKDRDRCMRYLVSMGFSYEEIKRAVASYSEK